MLPESVRVQLSFVAYESSLNHAGVANLMPAGVFIGFKAHPCQSMH